MKYYCMNECNNKPSGYAICTCLMNINECPYKKQDSKSEKKNIAK